MDVPRNGLLQFTFDNTRNQKINIQGDLPGNYSFFNFNLHLVLYIEQSYFSATSRQKSCTPTRRSLF